MNDDDLPGSALPPELRGLVTLREDGSLQFTRTVPTPMRALAVGGLGSVASLLLSVFVFLVLALLVGEGAWLGCYGLFGVTFSPLIAWLALRSATERVEADTTGISGRAPVRWGPDDNLWLTGDLQARRVELERVDAKGGVTLVRAWTHVRGHQDRGWDIDSIRWFAHHLADLGGVPLNEDLAPDADWLAKDQADRDRRAAAAARKKAEFAPYYEAEPEWPQEEWGPNGVAISIAGTSSVIFLITPSFSCTAQHRIFIDRENLRIGNSRLPIGRIEGLDVWFGEKRIGKRTSDFGEIHARTDRGLVLLVQRPLDSSGPGVLTGALASLNNALTWARAAEPQPDRGDASEVPDALRQVAGAARSKQGEPT